MNDVPEMYQKETLILGCGNVLFGDDGFGPEVIRYIEENCRIPDEAAILDAGTGVREILFTIALTEKKPSRIIIIDAYDCRKEPGKIFTIDLDDLPENKTDDFSLHQIPTSNLLRELRDLAGIEVRLVAAQPEHIPDTVCPGLSRKLKAAVPKAAEYLSKMGVINARVAHH